MRRRLPDALVVASLVGLGYAALTDGGFGARSGLTAATVLALAAVAVTRSHRLSDSDQWACVGLLVFAIVWLVQGGRGGITWREATLGVSALAWAGGYAVGRGVPTRAKRLAADGLVVVSVVVSAVAVVGFYARWASFDLVFDDVRRLSGPFAYPNALGLFAALGVVVAAASKRRWLGVAGVAVNGVVVVWSGSRGAWVAAVVGLALWYWRSARRPVPLRVVAAAAAVGFVLVLQAGLLGRVADTASSADRRAEWSAAWRAGTRNIATGIGPEAPLVISNFRGKALAQFAHNEPLQVFAGGGLTGVFALGAAMSGVAGALFARRPAPLAVAVTAVYLLGGLVDFGWHFVAVSAFTGMAAALDN